MGTGHSCAQGGSLLKVFSGTQILLDHQRHLQHDGIVKLPQVPRSGLKEPHYKHFSIERYRSMYELREKGKVLVRVIFTIQDSGEVMLLYAFIKRQKRDTMQALEQSIRILADLREHPEYAVEFKIKEETG